MTAKTKRGAGRNKTRKAQRAYKDHCRSMRKAGYVTDAHGTWVQNYKGIGISEANFRGSTAK